MARPLNQDFLHNSRFHVDVIQEQNLDLRTKSAGSSGLPQAGFSNVTTPEATIESVEYREGTYIYTRKQPGNASMSGDITMQRGVTRGDSSFWDWARCVIEGSGAYRADLNIKQYHRDTALTRAVKVNNGRDENNLYIDVATPARIYKVKEAFPTRCKPAADMDATASDISIMEMDCSYEYFEVEEGSAP